MTHSWGVAHLVPPAGDPIELDFRLLEPDLNDAAIKSEFNSIVVTMHGDASSI